METLVHHFKDGGYGMIPTLAFGIVFLAVAARYAVRPEKRVVPLMVALGTLTISAGLLGFVSGVIVTAGALSRAPEIPSKVAFFGVGEALNCVALAMIAIVLAAIAASVGAWRHARAVS
jgi:hypothetical protein